MAAGFVRSFAPQAGPIGRELKRLELLPFHVTPSDLDAKIQGVTAAFEKQLVKTQRTTGERRWLSSERSLQTASSGQDLVRVGLRALGLPADYVKHLFDASDKRAEREPNIARGRQIGSVGRSILGPRLGPR